MAFEAEQMRFFSSYNSPIGTMLHDRRKQLEIEQERGESNTCTVLLVLISFAIYTPENPNRV